MKVYVAIVQRPMASMDETLVEVFSTPFSAQRWVDEKLADEYYEGEDSEAMNWDIKTRIVE